MELKNKVMKLYKDVLEPEKERKIVLLLKYVIIDEETDLNRIIYGLDVSKSFIDSFVNDDSLMLNYLTHEEIKKFRFKMDKVLGKNSKLIKLIDLVLIKKETNIDAIIKSIPITVETMQRYANDKERVLRYLTEDEYKVFSDTINSKIGKSKTKLEKLIEVVMVEGETDLVKIEKKIPIKRDVIKAYRFNTKELEKYLNLEELNIFVNKIKKIYELEKEKVYKKDVELVKQIINDVLNTRYRYSDICAKNLFSIPKFEKYLYDEEFMKKEFPKITSKEIKSKIDENDRIRIRCPRNMFVIEDKYCVMIAKQDVHYLNQFDMKRLKIVSHYLGTGANLDSVIEYFKMSLPEILALLSSKNLEEILNEKYFMVLKQCLGIENILLGNDLNMKKQFIIEVTSFLEQNNFDMTLAMLYYKIPEPLFRKVLFEIIKLPYASVETKQTIKNVIDTETERKVK